ncbi:MAG: DUF4880 domain-containing protein [Pseudomonadales bacterium]|nr:DUF4880 domain-containing protein [Pseudomonadales bacterium]
MIKKAVQDEEQSEDVVAIRWFVRLRAEDKTEIEHDQFLDWLFESQTNQQAFTEILSLWNSLEVVKRLRFNKQLYELFDALPALNLLQKRTKNANLCSSELSQLSQTSISKSASTELLFRSS